MPNISNPQTSDNDLDHEDVSLEVLEFQQKKGYVALLEQLTLHFQKLVYDIFQKYPSEITFPIDTMPMEHFLLGFEIEYLSIEELIENDLIPHFCNPFDLKGSHSSPHSIEGFWFSDDKTNKVYIFINTSSNAKRQMFTKIHELFHFCQSLDPAFNDFLTEIINESTLPKKYIRNLIERSANKATAMYLIPETHLQQAYKETQDIAELALLYGVSQDTLRIRLEECNLIRNQNDIFDVPF